MSIRRRRGWASSVAVTPSLLLALLPRVACPACLAAYGSLVSTLGVGALYRARLVEPLIVGFLLLGVVGIAWSSRQHGSRGPLALTVAGSAAVIGSRLIWNTSAIAHVGVVMVAVASLWNLWCRSRRPLLVQIGTSLGQAPRRSRASTPFPHDQRPYRERRPLENDPLT